MICYYVLNNMQHRANNLSSIL